MNMLAMMQGETLLYTLPEGGWFEWPDGAMASPAVEGAGRGIWCLVRPAATFADMKAAKLAALADKRWQIENGGMSVAGMQVYTDDRSKLLINGAYRKAEKEPDLFVRFKAASGWITIDASAAIVLGDALFAHIQACFDREGVLAGLIQAAADQAALDAIDIDNGWPANS